MLCKNRPQLAKEGVKIGFSGCMEVEWRKTCNINVPLVFANQLKSWQNFQGHVEIQLLCDAL